MGNNHSPAETWEHNSILKTENHSRRIFAYYDGIEPICYMLCQVPGHKMTSIQYMIHNMANAIVCVDNVVVLFPKPKTENRKQTTDNIVGTSIVRTVLHRLNVAVCWFLRLCGFSGGIQVCVRVLELVSYRD